MRAGIGLLCLGFGRARGTLPPTLARDFGHGRLPWGCLRETDFFLWIWVLQRDLFQCFLRVTAFNWINWSCSAKKGSVQLSLFILYIYVSKCVDRSAHLVRMSSHIHIHKMIQNVPLHADLRLQCEFTCTCSLSCALTCAHTHILSHTYICLYVCMYVCLSVGLSVCLSVCLYVRLFVWSWPFVRLFVCCLFCLLACLLLCLYACMFL